MVEKNIPKSELKLSKLEEMIGIELTPEIKKVASSLVIFGISSIAGIGLLAYEFDNEKVGQVMSTLNGITIGVSSGYFINYLIQHKNEYF